MGTGNTQEYQNLQGVYKYFSSFQGTDYWTYLARFAAIAVPANITEFTRVTVSSLAFGL